ncbi:SDR family oxidoreductase [Sphingomonas sp. dw_22]|uniref:SDR family oxidoreductase n=1 Tax=Sphingomonas sp. dw_22 TaxID=2721175 RepID=UPI001BD27501|nr:SDR family oxidoreductase [Sphingomonas sp. dw_22]
MTQTILITGTSSGYGKATAELFLERGWNVVATMRRPQPELFDRAGDQVRVVGLDVTDSASIARAIDEAMAAFGAIDVVVNNAGIGLFSAFEITPAETIREVFETNTFGVMAVCQAIIPYMRARGSGIIVNFTSSAGIAPMPLVAPYCASKAAIEAFTESLDYELSNVGVRARLVEPGLAPTTSFAANGAERMAGLLSEPYQAYAAQLFAKLGDYPFGYATERQIAEAAFAAATDPSDRLRYPAGPDSEALAELRWTTSEETYLSQMREWFGPGVLAAV